MPRNLKQQRRNASRIQSYWRLNFKYNTTYKIISRLLADGMTTAVAKGINFETLVVRLREQAIISNFKAALRRIHMLTTFRHGSPSHFLIPENVNVRVVLAGFMIAYKPRHVFESIGALEKALVDAATLLIKAFETICAHIHRSKYHAFADVPAKLTKDFPTLLFQFLKCFKAWRTPDEAKLTCRIKHALLALLQAKEHISPEEPADSKIRVEFETQTRNLRLKLRQIAGDSALKEFDDRYKAGETAVQPHSGVYATLPGRISNQQLVHELLLDPDFQLNDDGGCDIENAAYEQIRVSFHRAFWNSLVDDMKLEPLPCFVRVLRVCGEISDALKELVNEREYSTVKEILDLDFIKQQAELGLYGPESCRTLVLGVVNVIRNSQLPKRDTSLNAEWPPLLAKMETPDHQIFCDALEFILERVQLMRVDHSNTRLRLIAPVIKTRGISYERDHFESQLRDGAVTLDNTTTWIDKSLRETVKLRETILDGIIHGRTTDYNDAHANAIFYTLTDEAPIRLHTLPETLLFDTHHLQRMQTEIKYITNATTMVMTLASAAPRSQQVIKAFVELLLSDDTVMDLETAEAAFKIDNKLLGIEDETTRTNARLALFRCIKSTDAVKQLMQLRVKKLLHGMVTTKADVVAPVMRPFMPRFQRTASKISKLIAINRTVHECTYTKLFKESALKIKEERKI